MSGRKINYLLSSTLSYGSSKKCPFCGNSEVTVDDRKYLVTRLLECQSCHLKFRHPKDDTRTNLKFYTEGYEETDGITTALPDLKTLEKLKDSNFANTPKNADLYIEVMKFLKPEGNIRVLDFGANWGYTSFQFQKAGFEVVPYEISKPRAKYGTDNLGVEIMTDLDQIEGQFDFVFSAHVIEHLPNINILFDLAKDILRDGGHLITMCPNGSEEYKKFDPVAYHKCWGHIHPNYISREFLETQFADKPFYHGSGNRISDILTWDKTSQITGDMTGWELFSVVKF